MSWQIREATLADAERICEINRDSLGYDYPAELTRARLAYVLAKPGNRVFVALNGENDIVCGYLLASDYEVLYCGRMKNILSLAVDTDYQGLGLGKLLLEAVEKWARDCGCEAVRLVSSFTRVEAHAFYQHCGYCLRKEQKNFIKYLNAR